MGSSWILRERSTETACIWRYGRLRRRIVGMNGWRAKESGVVAERREPPELQIRHYWASRLLGPPWWKIGRIRDFIRDGTCFACGGDFPYLHRAHIVARGYQGGSDHPANLHMLCRMCHEMSEGKTGLTYWRWFKWANMSDAIRFGVARRLELAGADGNTWGDTLTVGEMAALAGYYCAGHRGPLPPPDVRAKANSAKLDWDLNPPGYRSPLWLKR